MKAELRKDLRDALERVRSLADPSSDRPCAIAPEHKVAVAQYLKAWVLPPLERVLKQVDGEAEKQRKRVRFPSGGRR